MYIKGKLKRFYKNHIQKSTWRQLKNYYDVYRRNAFEDEHCKNEEQFEASITRLYHTIEKGLSYVDYRAGFGKDNLNKLLNSMEQYSAKQYDTEKFFYKCALSTLNAYIEKNKQYGIIDEKLNKRIKALPGKANKCGGIIKFTPLTEEQLHSANFETFIQNRHSIRHFTNEPVGMEAIIQAIEMAQSTPSACNRQGWSVKVIIDKEILHNILTNQNGNRGFGDEIDKLLLITGNLRSFNQSRELHQVFVDGGMYAMNVLHCLHYQHIASIPLSAALSPQQEKNVRKILQMPDFEIPILFIGLGSYPKECQTTRSERHEARYEVF